MQDLCLFCLAQEGDLSRPNKHKMLISDQDHLVINKALLENPFRQRTKLKADLNLLAKPFFPN